MPLQVVSLLDVSSSARPVTDQRAERVRVAAQDWTRQLVALGGRNTLLWFRDLPTGTLDLTTAHPSGVALLMTGRRTRLSSLLRADGALDNGRRRLRAITARARELAEERGLETAFVAFGMATWQLPGTEAGSPGASTPAAPVLLRSVAIRPTSPAQTDFDLDLGHDVELNPVLAHYLTTQAGIDVDRAGIEAAARGTTGFDPHPAFVALTQACGALPGFTISSRIIVGTFPYTKLQMVADLASQGDTLAGHDVIATLAGDPDALTRVQTGAKPGRTAPLAIRDRELRSDHVVLDADSAQVDAIEAVRDGDHLVIDAPPGTGATQTIANLLATLAADGKSVLLVAEKRAALEAVTDRLSSVGLGDLTIDLPNGPKDQDRLIEAVVETIGSLGVPAADRPALRGVRELRDRALATLNAHADATHAVREPFGVSAAEVFEAVSALARGSHPPRTRVRLSGGVLTSLDRPTWVAHRAELVRLARLGAWVTGPPGGDGDGSADPWFGARIATSAQAQEAQECLTRVSGDAVDQVGAEVARVLEGLTMGPAPTVRHWGRTLRTLAAVRATLETFRPEIFDEPLDLAIAATAGRNVGGERPGFWEERRIKAGVRRLLRPGRPPADLHAAVVRAAEQRTAWRQLAGAGGRPEIPVDLDQAIAAYDRLAEDLTWLDEHLPTDANSTSLLDTDREELHRRLAALAARPDRLAVVPDVRGPLDALEEAGLGPLITDLAARGVEPDAVAQECELAWWSSLADEIAMSDKRVGEHSGDRLRECAREYAQADRDVIADGATEVHTKVRARLDSVAASHPRQVSQLRALPGRDGPDRRRSLPAVVQECRDVLTAARPCWLMSPLVVAAVLPQRRLFDVVVVAEASQVPTADVISAISRARQVVLVGDPHQLPPATFAAAAAPAGSPSGSTSPSSEPASILDTLGSVLPTRRLRWDHRSLDERVMAFANLHTYDSTLLTFPGTTSEPVITLEHVDGSGVVADGRDAVESTSAEVDRVVELILDHARGHPEQSLGVVTLTPVHAAMIDDALRRVISGGLTEEMAGFFDDTLRQRFFIKEVEQVQGDTRDAIILAVGYGKTPHGRLLHRFGSLSRAGGERRLNVALTRSRRRMTVVSSLTAADLDPSRLRAPGAQLLREILEHAAGAPLPAPDGTTAAAATAVSGDDGASGDGGLVGEFATRLRAEGLVVREDVGAGEGRIELAIEDPANRGRLALAVETDGLAYAARPRGRDRERLYPEQLQRLGWRTMRVHLVDLYRDPAQEVARVVRAAGGGPVGSDVGAEVGSAVENDGGTAR